MATVGNAVLNLLRIHGVTNIAAERRRLNGSDHEILKRMGWPLSRLNNLAGTLGILLPEQQFCDCLIKLFWIWDVIDG